MMFVAGLGNETLTAEKNSHSIASMTSSTSDPPWNFMKYMGRSSNRSARADSDVIASSLCLSVISAFWSAMGRTSLMYCCRSFFMRRVFLISKLPQRTFTPWSTRSSDAWPRKVVFPDPVGPFFVS